MRNLMLLAAIGVLAACGSSQDPADPKGVLQAHARPLSVTELRTHRFETELHYERALEDGPGFSAYLVSYRHTGLKIYAMVAVPEAAKPASGYPVVIANHGYVPDPRRYGITRDGLDSRPGDYYRSVPELFTSRGFLVVIPDYRGHNSSEGYEFIDPQDEHSIGYYAEDVTALMSALGGLADADPDKVFMWSHSMGGPVSMRALLATDMVKASSFWSTMDVTDLFPYLANLDGPVMIQHSLGDEETSHSNSEQLAEALESIGHAHSLHGYDGDHHYFSGEQRELAADRDTEFFLSALADR